MVLSTDYTLHKKRLITLNTIQETMQNKIQREQRLYKHKQSISELWDDIKWLNLQVIGVPEGEEVNQVGDGVAEQNLENYLKKLRLNISKSDENNNL